MSTPTQYNFCNGDPSVCEDIPCTGTHCVHCKDAECAVFATTLDWIGGPTGDGKTLEQHAEELAAKHGVFFKAATPSGYHHDGFEVLFTSDDRDRLKALYLDGGPGDFDESFVVQVLGT